MSQHPTRGKTILVAEDHEDILDTLRIFLEGEGYRVVTAVDGQRAVEAAFREIPDLIMMDLNMPVLDGFQAAKSIRAHPSLRNVPILANSAHGEYGMRYSFREEELGSGFTFYLTKPIDLDDLRMMLERFLPVG